MERRVMCSNDRRESLARSPNGAAAVNTILICRDCDTVYRLIPLRRGEWPSAGAVMRFWPAIWRESGEWIGTRLRRGDLFRIANPRPS